MKSSRFIDRRTGYLFGAVSLLIGMVVPAVFPAFVSADQLSSRSIQMSSASISATGTQYKVTFTPTQGFKSVIIDFCSDSPIAGESCSTSHDATLSSATVGTAVDSGSVGSLGTLSATPATNSIEIDGTTADTAGDSVSITINNVTNPDQVESFYARIYTYADSTAAAGHTSPTVLGTTKDTGGIALSTAADIGVTAAVRETLTFCVSAVAPGVACGSTTAPTITLGHNSGSGDLALDSSATDTADVYTQVSSNASSGVAVMMKSGNQCGGLHRFGASATVCDIPAVGSLDAVHGTGTDAITPGVKALFGMKLGTDAAASGATDALGTVVQGTDYTGASGVYGLDYMSDDSSGVTSPYGSEIYNTTGPSNDWNVPMTFGATVTNATPAGKYSQNLSLIATGTY